MEVRAATRSDVAALAQLHAATVTVAYAGIFPADSTAPTPAELEPDYRQLFELGDHLWVVDHDDSLVGSIALVADSAVPAGCRIERFNVHPNHQSSGLGSSLYRQALRAAGNAGWSSLNLWVLEENERARAIYEAWGWALVPGRTLANDPPEVLDVLYQLRLA